MYKCKYCGQELKRGFENVYYEYDYCSCEGQKRASLIKREIAYLEAQISHKKEELNQLLRESYYGKIKREKNLLEHQLRNFADAIYEEGQYENLRTMR